MPTLKDTGFTIDDFYMSCLVPAIRSVKTVTVEDRADTLTDRKHPATFTDAEIEWMKKTPVSRITMGTRFTEGSGEFFYLIEDGQDKLKISDRPATMGEFRAEKVRDLITDVQGTGDQALTVYDAFQAYLRHVPNNSHFIYAATPAPLSFLNQLNIDDSSIIFKELKTALTSSLMSFGETVYGHLNELELVSPSSEAQISLEGQQLLNKYLEASLDETPISPLLLGIVHAYHHLSASSPEGARATDDEMTFTKAFYQFEKQLQLIKQKSTSLKQGSNAQLSAETLHAALSDAAVQLLNGKCSIEQFKQNCTSACESAETSDLKNHRGWKQVIANILFTVVSIALLGVANLASKVFTGSFRFFRTETDSLHKVWDMKRVLNNISVIPEVDDQSDNSDTNSVHSETSGSIASDLSTNSEPSL